MDIWTILGALYMTSVLFAIMMTRREQRQQDAQPVLLKIAGVLACTVWPAVVAAMILLHRGEDEQLHEPTEAQLDRT